MAEEFLEKEKFTILQKNYRCKGGEIDLIVEKGGEIHFVEVKTRSGSRYGSPLEAITYDKRKKLSFAAHYYLLCNPQWNSHPRCFSVISIECGIDPPEILFFPNAFEVEGDYY